MTVLTQCLSVCFSSVSVSLSSPARFSVLRTEITADKDTPEQIIAAFKTLANDGESIAAYSLRVPPLNNEDVEYLSGATPGVSLSASCAKTWLYARGALHGEAAPAVLLSAAAAQAFPLSHCFTFAFSLPTFSIAARYLYSFK